MNERIVSTGDMRLVTDFCARYGLRVDESWTDELIEQALADHAMPPMAYLPDQDVAGIMAIKLHDEPLRPDQVAGWRRANALHLLAHVVVHGGVRCGGCQAWGEGWTEAERGA